MNIPVLAGAGFTVFSAYLLQHAVKSYKSSVASQAWPVTDGKLTEVHLWGKRKIDGETKAADNLAVEYCYEVGGIKYTGSSATFYTLIYPETIKFANRYSKNSNINVYYNLNDPAESVLIPGLNPGKPYSDLIMGVFGVATGIVISWLGWVGAIG